MDFDGDLLVSKQLNNKFALKYRIANHGIPVNVKLNSKYLSDLIIRRKKGEFSC